MKIGCLVWLAVRRLRSRLALSALSLLGVVLTVGWVASLPIFSQSVSYVMLREELARLGGLTHRPPLSLHVNYLASPDKPLSVAAGREVERQAGRMATGLLGLPMRESILRVASPAMVVNRPTGNPDAAAPGQQDTTVTLEALEGIEAHIEVLEGSPFGEGKRSDRWPVWVEQEAANALGLMIGDEYNLFERDSGMVFLVYIAGVWQPADHNDEYWFNDPAGETRAWLVPMGTYEAEIEPLLSERSHYTTWYFVLDDRLLDVARAGRVAQGLRALSNRLLVLLPGGRIDHTPGEPLARYLQRKSVLSVLLVSFGIPVMGLLFYFLSLISTVTVQFQREEAAIMASRGAGRGLVVALAGIEALLLIVAGTPIGLLVGYALARLMGYSESFLIFVSRPPLPASLTGLEWRLLAGAIAVLLAARLLPAFDAARQSIVTRLQRRSRQVTANVASRLALDVPLAAATAYAYSQLRERGTLGLLSLGLGGSPLSDPLLLLAPSLFVFTAALVLTHLFPLLVRPFDWVAGRLRSFGLYAGLRQLVRQSAQYTSPLFLVIVCLSLGAFYASLAQSLDRWLDDRVAYETGADYTFALVPLQDSTRPVMSVSEAPPADGPLAEGGWLLPISDYETLPGVLRAARVGEYGILPALPDVGQVRFLGIDRTDLPAVIYYRGDYSTQLLGELMNRLALDDRGVIVPRAFLERNGLSEGQPLTATYSVAGKDLSIPFVIVGTYDYFPTVLASERPAFIGNLEYFIEQVGTPLPFGVWLRTTEDADTASYPDRLARMGVGMTDVKDRRLLVWQEVSRVERVGLFGSVSLGFLAASILSALGLLIYSFASLQSRLQGLSVLRAIGVQALEALVMEAVEYGGVILFGLAAGAAVGGIASYLYVPFYQYASQGGVPIPPFLPRIAWPQVGWMALVFAVALTFSQFVLLRQAMQREFFQVLRMGQRE